MSVLLQPTKPAATARISDHARAEALTSIAIGLGAAVAVVGWTDLALLWFPAHFGSPEWEVGTISRHFDGLALGTVGLGLLAVGLVGRGWRHAVRGLSILCLIIAVAQVVASVLYLLDVPVALRGAPFQVKPILEKGMLKCGIFAATYLALYAWLGVYLWRTGRRRAQSAAGGPPGE